MYFVLFSAFISYIAIVRYYRYQYLKKLKCIYPDPASILKDGQIAQEIYCQTFRREFPCNWRRRRKVDLLYKKELERWGLMA